MALAVGFKIVCIFSLLLSILAVAGIGWLVSTRYGNNAEKFVSSTKSQPKVTETTRTEVPPPRPPNSHSFLGEKKNKNQLLQGQKHRHGMDRQQFEAEYENIKYDLLEDWEHNTKPVLLSCCIVVITCACLQCISSLVGLLDYSQVNTKTKTWLILHFILFFAYVLCVLTMFITNMNREPMQKFSFKSNRLQVAATQRAGPTSTTRDSGQDLFIQEESNHIIDFIKFSSSLFYIIVSTNASLILLLFFVVIWLMKEDHGYNKYQQIGS